jgi:predicted pyridoxine 5'-phosphate oxidase superfamily flavin-nucleotide-binding protein
VLELTDEMRTRLSSALADGFPVITSTVDADGQPHLSFYGTAQVLNSQQVALWVRNPEGGLLTRIVDQPRIALMYRNGPDRVSYQFHGTARIESDEAVRTEVFDNSPEVERSLDPDRKGVAVVIDVDRVQGRAHGEPIHMVVE